MIAYVFDFLICALYQSFNCIFPTLEVNLWAEIIVGTMERAKKQEPLSSRTLPSPRGKTGQKRGAVNIY